MAKLSFDFDDTLDRESVQRYAKQLINEGHDIWVVTARCTEDQYAEELFSRGIVRSIDINKDLYIVTDSLGIPREKIIFMNYTPKYTYMRDKDFLWHLDDDDAENRFINDDTNTIPISSLNPDWEIECEKLLNK